MFQRESATVEPKAARCKVLQVSVNSRQTAARLGEKSTPNVKARRMTVMNAVVASAIKRLHAAC